MAKHKKFSYKNLKINTEDLAITKVGEMSNANKSPIFLFFVFGIFIAFVFFLPDIMEYISNKGIPFLITTTTNEEEENPENDVNNELVYYDISPELVVNLEDGIVADKFELKNNLLTFTITNRLSSRFYFSKRNYFIELYNGENTLLERIILTKQALASEERLNVSYELLASTAESAKKIVFVEKQIEDYPNIELTKNEASEEVLTCKKDFETLTYTFKEQKLQEITDSVNQTNMADPGYQENFHKWQENVNNYSKINGINASIFSNESGFMVNIIIDLKNINESSLNNPYYYSYNTLAKVIDFEMKARGFQCS